MIKTIPVTYRAGVFVPLTAVKEIAEETALLRSDLSADEIHYLIESPELAEESIWLALEPAL